MYFGQLADDVARPRLRLDVECGPRRRYRARMRRDAGVHGWAPGWIWQDEAKHCTLSSASRKALRAAQGGEAVLITKAVPGRAQGAVCLQAEHRPRRAAERRVASSGRHQLLRQATAKPRSRQPAPAPASRCPTASALGAERSAAHAVPHGGDTRLDGRATRRLGPQAGQLAVHAVVSVRPACSKVLGPVIPLVRCAMSGLAPWSMTMRQVRGGRCGHALDARADAAASPERRTSAPHCAHRAPAPGCSARLQDPVRVGDVLQHRPQALQLGLARQRLDALRARPSASRSDPADHAQHVVGIAWTKSSKKPGLGLGRRRLHHDATAMTAQGRLTARQSSSVDVAVDRLHQRRREPAVVAARQLPQVESGRRSTRAKCSVVMGRRPATALPPAAGLAARNDLPRTPDRDGRWPIMAHRCPATARPSARPATTMARWQHAPAETAARQPCSGTSNSARRLFRPPRCGRPSPAVAGP